MSALDMRHATLLQAKDGVRLFTRRWDADRPAAACILVHGLGEHSGRYDRFARDLNARGITVWSQDHRGHGRSGGQRGDCASVASLVEDLKPLVELAAREAPALPRAIVGHSLGGLLALTFAAEHPESVRAVAVSSPALGVAMPLPKLKVSLVRALAKTVSRLPVPNGVHPGWLSRDPEVVRAYQADPLVHGTVTARCAVSLERAVNESVRLAEKLTVPCLILQAGDDRICDAAASQRFALEVHGAPVTFRRYDGLYHELFNEPERGRVIDDLCDWLLGTLR